MLKENQFTALDALLLALVACASIIGINQYTYGMYNHYISIPFIKDLMDPSLYPHDFLLAEQKYFYTYFNKFFAGLSSSLHISLPVLFFAFYCVSLYATLIAFFKIALVMFKEKTVAYFAVILLIFSFNTLGDIRTVESLFLERTFVLPILLFAIYAFLQQRFILSYVLAGVAFLFHPLSAVYTLAGLGFCSVLSLKEIGVKKFAISLGLLVLIISPVLYLKVQNPAPSLSLFHPDKEWIDLLRLRSAHHVFPFLWRRLPFLQAILFVAGFVLCMQRYRPAAEWHHRVAMGFCGAVLLMCLGGIIFTEFMPVSIIVQFQLFRSFVFLVYFGMLYYAYYFFRESKSVTPMALLVMLMGSAIFYNDNIPKFGSFFVALLLIFPGYSVVEKSLPQLRKFYFPGMVALLIGLGIGGAVLKGGFTIQTGQEENWLAVQRWAKENTAQDAIFIMSPQMDGFRVESERTSYGDWKDGTQMFFNPEFGKEWIRRMKMEGWVKGQKLHIGYNAMELDDFMKITAELSEHSEVYAILPREKTLPVAEVFSNAKFGVYKLKPLVRTVSVKNFYIDQSEVSSNQYREYQK